jgi:hypothetical protein
MAVRERRLLWLRALLHDASEAYCNDIARPVKRSISGYDEIETANQRAIEQRFGIPWHGAFNSEALQLIKQADNAMLLAEQSVIMKPAPATWAPVEVPPAMLASAEHRLGSGAPARWTPAKAERVFLARYLELAT